MLEYWHKKRKEPRNIGEETTQGPSITIELWLQPGSEPQGNLPHIFSIYDRSGPEGFFIGQCRSHLIVGKDIHGKDGYHEMGIRDILKKGERRFVAITSGADGTRIYVGGILSEANPRFYLFSTNEKPAGQMVLGNSPTGNEYWTGNLLGLAIYNRVLTEQEVSQHYHGWKNSGEEGLVAFYPLDEGFGQWGYDRACRHNLFIPPRFEVLQKTILTPPWGRFSIESFLSNGYPDQYPGFYSPWFLLLCLLPDKKAPISLSTSSYFHSFRRMHKPFN